MGYLPEVDEKLINPIIISRDEFNFFIDKTVFLAIGKLREKNLVK